MNNQSIFRNDSINTSHKYSTVNTKSLFEAFENEGFLVRSIQQARVKDKSKEGFQKHLVRFGYKSPNDVQVGGHVPEIVLKNSYDGKSSIQLSLGVFRLVCSNGLVVGSTFQSFRIPHIGDALHEALNAAHTLSKEIPKVLDTVNELSSIILTDSQAHSITKSVSELVLPENAIISDDTIKHILRPRRYNDNAMDAFSVFNRIQESMVRGRVRYVAPNDSGMLERKTTRAVNSIDKSFNKNKELWNMFGNVLKSI